MRKAVIALLYRVTAGRRFSKFFPAFKIKLLPEISPYTDTNRQPNPEKKKKNQKMKKKKTTQFEINSESHRSVFTFPQLSRATRPCMLMAEHVDETWNEDFDNTAALRDCRCRAPFTATPLSIGLSLLSITGSPSASKLSFGLEGSASFNFPVLVSFI